MKERLQKILSAYGVASRRAAEQIIAAGRVAVNGARAELGQSADPDTDKIDVDGVALVKKAEKLYIMLNKPRGYVTTMRDEKGRKDVTALLTGCPARVWPVGRLDLDSEGLLIMTNDGDLTNFLTHPSHEKEKEYHVRVRGETTRAIELLSVPMTIDGVRLMPAAVRFQRKTEDGAVLSMTIREGKNRQIRKMCAQVGLEVTNLRRVAEGGLRLGTLKSGSWRYLSGAEVAALKSTPDASAK